MKRSLVLQSIVAGLIAVGVSAHAGEKENMEKAMGEGDYRCLGGNMCKGKGACHGPGYSCAGNNKCMGKGFVMTKSREDCLALKAKVQDALKAKKKKKS